MRYPLLMLIVTMATGCDTTPIGLQPTSTPPAGTSAPAPHVVPALGVETPQAVMQRYEDARKRGDYRARADCVTPETLQAFAAMKIRLAASYGGVGRDTSTLQRYGIKAETLREIAGLPPDSQRLAAETHAKTISDQAGLYGEMIAEEMLQQRVGETPPAEITSVNIQGDSATAHVVADIQGQPFHADVQLKMINGRWKVDDTRHYRH